jgi:hypothetical protein
MGFLLGAASRATLGFLFDTPWPEKETGASDDATRYKPAAFATLAGAA